jgi:hypothetical protein
MLRLRLPWRLPLGDGPVAEVVAAAVEAGTPSSGAAKSSSARRRTSSTATMKATGRRRAPHTARTSRCVDARRRLGGTDQISSRSRAPSAPVAVRRSPPWIGTRSGGRRARDADDGARGPLVKARSTSAGENPARRRQARITCCGRVGAPRRSRGDRSRRRQTDARGAALTGTPSPTPARAARRGARARDRPKLQVLTSALPAFDVFVTTKHRHRGALPRGTARPTRGRGRIDRHPACDRGQIAAGLDVGGQ